MGFLGDSFVPKVRQWLETSLQPPSTTPSSPIVAATAALSTEDAVLTATQATEPLLKGGHL